MRSLRLALVLGFLLLPSAVPLARSWRSEHATARFDLADAPRTLAGLRAVGDGVLEKRVFDVIAPSAYLMRSFSDGTTEALVYIAFYTGFDSTAAHDPQVCYPAQGFDIGEIHDVTIPLADGHAIWSKIFLARQGAQQEVILHWFQPLDRWPAGPRLEPWIRMLESFRGHKAYAFVRISVGIEEQGGMSGAREHAIAMAAEFAPWARAVISRAIRDRSGGEEAPHPRTQVSRHGNGQRPPGA